jgi:hypothetical protein
MLVLSMAAAQSPYVLDARETKKVQATLRYEVTHPHLKAKEWVVFLAEAPELPRQRGVKMTIDPAGVRIKEIGGAGRDMVRLRLPVVPGDAAEKSLRLTVHYEATLHACTLRSRRAGEAAPLIAPLTKVERDRYLAEKAEYDFSRPAFQAWMKHHRLTRKQGEADVDFARRVFLAIVQNFKYEYAGAMDRRASAVCVSKASDCGGMAMTFVAALRSQGIPARALFGRWAQSSKMGETLSGVEYHQWHVKAEFYAAEVGWTPVDLSSAVVHDKSPEKLHYFGNDPGNFLVQHVDPAWKVDTVHFGQHDVSWMQLPVYWVTGMGNLNDAKTRESWHVR